MRIKWAALVAALLMLAALVLVVVDRGEGTAIIAALCGIGFAILSLHDRS